MDMRQELHAYLDIMPESKLRMLAPLLSFLACETSEKKIFIETDLTEEEHAIIAQGMEEYARNPDSFSSLECVTEREDY